MPPEPIAEIATFIHDLSEANIPMELRPFVERRFIDTVGVLMAGARKEPAVTLQRQLASMKRSHPEAPLITAERGFVLGTSGHCLDFDDSTHSTHAHVSVALVPTIIALSHTRSISGLQAYEGYIAGFETAHYLAELIMEEHYTMGWHGTGTVGVFAATGAAAKIFALDVSEIETALCMAASMPAGLRANFGSMTKPLHAGLAVRSGLTAVLQTAAGITANSAAMTGKHGFFDVYVPNIDCSERKPKKLGTTWGAQREGANTKLYPCCHEIHAGLEAAVQLTTIHETELDKIESIEITAAPLVVSNTNIRHPTTPAEAKFSMSYVIASALIYGEVTLETFTQDRIDDPAIHNLETRITLESDETTRTSYSTSIEIVDSDGTRITQTNHNPPGKDRTVTEEQLKSKFEMCTQYLSEVERRQVYEFLSNLTEQQDISFLQGYCYPNV